MLKRPLIWAPLLLVGLLLLAFVGSRWFVPSLVRSQADAYVANALPGKALDMGEVSFDPFSLTLVIADLAIGDAGKRPMLSVQRLSVDAAAASLWTLSPKLDAVRVEGASVDAVLRPDGSLNLAELVPPDDGEPIPQLWIGDLQVTGSELAFTDARRGQPVRKRLRPVAFTLADFATTSSEGGGFRLNARSDEGELFAWDGRLAMAPVASAGNFRVEGLQLATIGRFAGDLLPVSLGGGTTSLAGSYRFAAPPAPAQGAAPAMTLEVDLTSLRVDDAALVTADGDSVTMKAVTLAPTRLSLAGDAVALGAVQVEGVSIARPTGETVRVDALALGPTRYGIASGVAEVGAATVRAVALKGRGTGASAVTLASLAVAPSRVDTAVSRADIGLVSARGLRVAGEVTKSNDLRIPGLYPMPGSRKAAAQAPSAWTLALAGFQLDDAAVKLSVAGAGAPKQVSLAPMRVSLGPLTSALDAPLQLDFATGLNGRARASAKGKVAPDGSRADLAVELVGLSLAEVLALAPPIPGVQVRGGTAGAKGALTVRPGKSGPAIGYAGDANIANFALEEKSGEALVQWARLDLNGIRYAAAPASLSIAQVTFDRPVSHVVITRQAQLNVARAAGIEATVGPTAGTPADDSGPPAETARTVVKVAAPVSGGLEAAGEQIPISIGAVRVKGGTIAFDDLSIEPSFSARIEGFNGQVKGLSSKPGSQAVFDLQGYVIDRFSPVEINGRANVFAYDANTDLTASFRNIELPVFNPYSGRFAGYSIAKGKLSTTIHYKIVNRSLDAQHNVVIDQLEWGQATDSKDKVSLPIRLATSLLKDKDGVIDLDLPVGGTLDDPTFKIWPVIWQVVGNVMTKLVAAPFRLIGSLFEGADKAQFIAFDPGSAALSAEAAQSLAQLAKGLVDRKEVNLEIPAGPGVREDAAVMAETALQAAAMAAKKGKGESFDALQPDAQADRLKAVYKAKFGKGPKFPDGEVAKAGMFAGGEAKAEAAAAQAQWLRTELLPKFAPDDAALAALGQARANAVKEALLGDGALDPGRVFLSTNATVKPKDASVEMEIGVK